MTYHIVTSPQDASAAARILAGKTYSLAEAFSVLESARIQARNGTLPGLDWINAQYSRPEFTSQRILEIAERGVAVFSSITDEELRAVAGSVLSQAPDRSAAKVYPFGLMPPLGAHAYYNRLAGPRPVLQEPDTVETILERNYGRSSPLADYLRRGSR